MNEEHTTSSTIVSSTVVSSNGYHDKVRVFNRGALSGELTTRFGDGKEIARRLEVDRGTVPASAVALLDVLTMLLRREGVITLSRVGGAFEVKTSTRRILKDDLVEAIGDLADFVSSDAIAKAQVDRTTVEKYVDSCGRLRETVAAAKL